MPPDEVEVIDLTGLSESSEGEEGDEEEEGEEESASDAGSDAGSDASEVEMILGEETRAQLQTAIDTVSEVRLRQMLKDLICTEQAVELALTRELVTLTRDTRSIVPRWETCANCDDEYDINTPRTDDECSFHPGLLNIIKEKFVDREEQWHGPMDSPENRRDCPENFCWSCCEKDAAGEGCVRGEHKSAVSRKRRRI